MPMCSIPPGGGCARPVSLKLIAPAATYSSTKLSPTIGYGALLYSITSWSSDVLR